MTKRQELEKLQILRGKILDVMAGSAEAAEIDSFTYSEADGSQSVKRRDPKALMEWLNQVDKKIELLERSLRGSSGLMTFGTNRYAK